MNPFKYGRVVSGDNYCPRPGLAAQFQKLVAAGRNVVVQGERRMGKTSFVCESVRAMTGARLLYVDLFCVKTLSEFCRRAAVALAETSQQESFLRRLVKGLASLRPQLALDPASGSPTLTLDLKAANSVSSVEEVMAMVADCGQDGKLCVVFDEFQDLLDVPGADALLARLRAKIQFMEKTAVVFLGSVRNRMDEVFSSPGSPFYKSAAAFSVGAIPPEDFVPFLIGRFAAGRRRVDAATVASIVQLADGVSGDAQELCETAWLATEDGAAIDEAAVRAGLETVFSREMQTFAALTGKLTATQTAVLRGLAADGQAKVYGGDFLEKAGIKNVGTVTRALKRLVDDNLLYEYDGRWRFCNPFLREWLRRSRG